MYPNPKMNKTWFYLSICCSDFLANRHLKISSGCWLLICIAKIKLGNTYEQPATHMRHRPHCCKTDKKNEIFKIVYFGGDLRGPKIGKKAKNNLIQEPLTPLKKFFGKFCFFICFTIAHSFWNNFCFLVNCIFFTSKRKFLQKHGFW